MPHKDKPLLILEDFNTASIMEQILQEEGIAFRIERIVEEGSGIAQLVNPGAWQYGRLWGYAEDETRIKEIYEAVQQGVPQPDFEETLPQNLDIDGEDFEG